MIRGYITNYPKTWLLKIATAHCCLQLRTPRAQSGLCSFCCLASARPGSFTELHGQRSRDHMFGHGSPPCDRSPSRRRHARSSSVVSGQSFKRSKAKHHKISPGSASGTRTVPFPSTLLSILISASPRLFQSSGREKASTWGRATMSHWEGTPIPSGAVCVRVLQCPQHTLSSVCKFLPSTHRNSGVAV